MAPMGRDDTLPVVTKFAAACVARVWVAAGCAGPGLLHRRVECAALALSIAGALRRGARSAGARRGLRHPAVVAGRGAQLRHRRARRPPSSTWRGACGASIRAGLVGVGDMSLPAAAATASCTARTRTAAISTSSTTPSTSAGGRWAPVESMPRYPFFDLRAREAGAAGAWRRVRPLLDALLRRQAQLGAGARAARGARDRDPDCLSTRGCASGCSPTRAEQGEDPDAPGARRGDPASAGRLGSRTTITCTCGSSAPRAIAPSAVADAGRCAGGRSATSTWCRRCRASVSTSLPARWRSSSGSSLAPRLRQRGGVEVVGVASARRRVVASCASTGRRRPAARVIGPVAVNCRSGRRRRRDGGLERRQRGLEACAVASSCAEASPAVGRPGVSASGLLRIA